MECQFKTEHKLTNIEGDCFVCFFVLGRFCLCDLILYVPVNNFSVMSGRIVLG